jgi:hypothetical protein
LILVVKEEENCGTARVALKAVPYIIVCRVAPNTIQLEAMRRSGR